MYVKFIVCQFLLNMQIKLVLTKISFKNLTMGQIKLYLTGPYRSRPLSNMATVMEISLNSKNFFVINNSIMHIII